MSASVFYIMCEPLVALSQIQGFLLQEAFGESCMSGKTYAAKEHSNVPINVMQHLTG